uniref:RNA-directed DNA polymerase (Reverse transcriptase) n=1 Tax=Medicago truncatula TaxID=3880 RepID=Q2HUG4_MEDTR|nr:RNA-directed DNA polymerase (Reverse transcriptase) [Medicago truncatula]
MISSFKFLKMWTLHDSCQKLIEDCWNVRVLGSPLYVLSSKLKVWNKDVFGNILIQVTQAEKKLSDIQNHINTSGHNDNLMNAEKIAQTNLDLALQKQETFWVEKAKLKWHVGGDRNTKYFHRLTKIKNKTKIISSLRKGEEILTDQTRISEHDHLLVEEAIPKLVDATTNRLLTMLPTKEEVKNAVFDLNSDDAPGPDVFGACFFQIYWNIVKKDVYEAVLDFFKNGWLPNNFNANSIILIPKTPNADSVDQYRTIALVNFKFKIINKVLADRLAKILPSIISKEQRGFVQGRNIRDCIALTSEAINVLDNKSFGGNLALKIDVTKAFDTLNWDFLLLVLKTFGFNELFCNWIKTILHSSKMFISMNGAQHGFFNCNRGVRQGDPLSPLLFCIVEEVLSRSISILADKGLIDLIAASRNNCLPFHCFYVDDLMVFCKAKMSSLIVLKSLFTRYADCSGQIMNIRKSFIFAGGITDTRMNNIVNILGFNVGSLPFTYLGAPIFKGKPKGIHFQPIADKVKAKLAKWKASLLSIAGRIQLVKSVVQSMLVHTMSIYSWPIKILKEMEKWIKNFIWSGDVTKRKMVTVAWRKICADYEEGGLGVKSLICLNEATNLKICWNLMQSDEQWANIIRNSWCGQVLAQT